MSLPPFVETKISQECIVFVFSGDWRLNMPFKQKKEIFSLLKTTSVKKISFSFQSLESWDSSLIAFLVRLETLARKKSITTSFENAPSGVLRLINLALTVPAHQQEKVFSENTDFFTVVGEKTLQTVFAVKNAIRFFKHLKKSFNRFFYGKAVMRKRDFLTEMQNAGFDALPIVSLISFMVGLILAFVGAVQLKMFGAQIYVASLVAIAMSRVMGAVMAGIIMAGRTGASYAATIGSMQVNEEVDALETMGISPYDFLVLPKILALALMLPLLTIYANLMSILGGAFVGIFMLDLTPNEYFTMTLNSLFIKNIVIGLIQSFVFGVIVALCGCYCGIRCERNASAVGQSTTSAVVYSIVWIVVATGVITVICNAFGV